MATKKKLLEAAAGAGGSTAWTFDDVTPPTVDYFYLGNQGGGPQGATFKPDGTKMYVAESGSDSILEYDLSTAWDLTTASYLQSFSVASQEVFPRGTFFKPDGTKMYVVGSDSDSVHQYDLSTAWDVTTASYVKSISVAVQDATPEGVFLKDDGTRMYVVGAAQDKVYQYNLSTAWDLDTAIYNSAVTLGPLVTAPTGVFFKSDGTKMYVTDTVGDDVNEYSLVTAWQVSTANHVQTFSATETTNPESVSFKDDGTEMYVLGGLFDTVYKYSLSTAWDISTATWATPSRYYSVSSQELQPNGVCFKGDGTKMYVIGANQDRIQEYNLSTAWDITTSSYVQFFSVSAQESISEDLFFKPDGTKVYIIGSSDTVYQYNLSTAWDISTASYIQGFYVGSEEAFPYGISFKDDGTKMYICGSGAEAVWAYSLSTAWDISTASIPSYGRYDVASEESQPTGGFFKDDGTKMYIIGTSGTEVNEYTLSTAWDVSTASFIQNFSVNAEDGAPQDLSFKSDGTKLYMVGTASDAVYEYNLSTAWDLSTASYSSNSFSVLSQAASAQGLFFKPDGLKMYVACATNLAVYEYNLGTAWNVSTAAYVQSFSVSSESSYTNGVFFKSDGTKMYITDLVNDYVYEYNLSTAWDISTASYSGDSLNIIKFGCSPTGLYFKSDGNQMIVFGSNSDFVLSFSVSTAWDISTAAWDAPANSYFNVYDQDVASTGVAFESNGNRMFVCGRSSNAVHRYDLSSAWDISTSSYIQSYFVTDQTIGVEGLAFRDDGTEMYVVSDLTDAVWSYSLVQS